jgi:hypothetical protein
MFRAVFWVVQFTRQYNPEGSSEHHTRRHENLKSHNPRLIDIDEMFILFK